MLELGLILIGTGIIVIGSGRAMTRSTKKMMSSSRYYKEQEDIEAQHKTSTKTEEEFSSLVQKSMIILTVVGMTCIGLGILLILFGRA